MKLIDFKKLPPQDRQKQSLIVGVKAGKPVLVCTKKSDQTWTLYKNIGQSSLKKENLEKLGKLASLEDLLAFMNDKGLKPFGPKEQSISDKDMAPLRGSIQDAERRRHYRKKVDLPGGYYSPRTQKFRTVRILDVSFKGVKFAIDGSHVLKVGDMFQMTFTLDNAKQSEIKRKVEIKHITKDGIGAKFINPPEYDKDLGFYLL